MTVDSPSGFDRKIKNVDPYVREKVINTIHDLETVAQILRNFLAFADKLEQKGVSVLASEVPKRKDIGDLGNLRYPGGFAGPDGALSELRRRAEHASLWVQDVAKNAGIDLEPLTVEVVGKVFGEQVKELLERPGFDSYREAREEALKKITL